MSMRTRWLIAFFHSSSLEVSLSLFADHLASRKAREVSLALRSSNSEHTGWEFEFLDSLSVHSCMLLLMWVCRVKSVSLLPLPGPRKDISAVLTQFSFSLRVATSQRFVNGAFSGWNFPWDISLGYFLHYWDSEKTFPADHWPGVHDGSRSLWGVALMSWKQPLGKCMGCKRSLLKTIQVWLDNNGV